MNLRQLCIALACGAIVYAAVAPARTARSQQLTIQQALQEIRSTAADVCQSAPLEATNQGVSLSGEATAKVGGLIGKLADLGVTGAGQYQAGSSRGVLQKDLVSVILNSNDCRLEVFRTLAAKLIPEPAAASGVPGAQERIRVPSTNDTSATVSPLNRPVAPIKNVKIDGRWIDNVGNSYLITQLGDEFSYTTEGIACNGRWFRSNGHGRLAGWRIHMTSQSNIGGNGECFGALSMTGMSIRCDDSICGSSSVSLTRQ